MFLTKCLLECPSSTTAPPSLPWKISGFAHVSLSNFSVNCAGLYAMYCIRHIKNNSAYSTLFFLSICQHIPYSPIETLLRHIQTYSGIFSTLCNHRIFRALAHLKPETYLKSWNIDQAYSEPCHRAILSHILEYSESCATLA